MRSTVAIALVMCGSALAVAAPWFEAPPGYTKKAGGDEYVALARAAKSTTSVDVQLYASRDEAVELTRITWTFKPAQPLTRSALEQFDRELVTNTTLGVTTHVSDMRKFDGDQMGAEAFDEIAKLRVYHRRLYAVDTAGVVHLFWVICSGTAAPIAACEQAQRTMKLTLPNQAVLPPGPPPPPPPVEPWSFVLPPGYVEKQGAVEDEIKRLGKAPDVVSSDGRMYESSDHAVRLIGLIWTTMAYLGKPTWRDLETLDRSLVAEDSRHVTRHVSDSRQRVDQHLIAETIDELEGMHYTQRRLIGVESSGMVHVFTVMCIGPEHQLSACKTAQHSMRLALFHQVMPATEAPSPAAAQTSAQWRPKRVLASSALIALVVGLAIWIYRSAVRGARRRRRRD